MKKYKLIKEYPGSPKIDSIVETKSYGGYALENSISYFMTKDKVENQPEFWEEVVEKDYEILSLARFCSIKPTITDVSDYGDEFIEALLKCDKSRIHSVKRLSDGEIFTIGDIVKCEDCKGKITSLEIYDNDIYLNGIDNKMPFGYTLCNTLDCFEIPQKVKQPIFKTEDGVDIFEGDKLYSICNMLNIKKHRLFNARYDDNTLLNNRIFFNSDYKHFSTKEKAEEYILMNEPCLSINDMKAWRDLAIPELKKLVKTKLKND